MKVPLVRERACLHTDTPTRVTVCTLAPDGAAMKVLLVSWGTRRW